MRERTPPVTSKHGSRVLGGGAGQAVPRILVAQGVRR